MNCQWLRIRGRQESILVRTTQFPLAKKHPIDKSTMHACGTIKVYQVILFYKEGSRSWGLWARKIASHAIRPLLQSLIIENPSTAGAHTDKANAKTKTIIPIPSHCKTHHPPVHRQQKTSSALTQNSAMTIKCSFLITVGCFEIFFIFFLPLAKSSSFLTRLLLFTAKREHEASKSLHENQNGTAWFVSEGIYTRFQTTFWARRERPQAGEQAPVDLVEGVW